MSKSAINTTWYRLTAFLLGILGFSSCFKIGNEPVMYGQPVLFYSLRLHGIVNDENNHPINGIRVIVENKGDAVRDTLYTSQTGEYNLKRKYDHLYDEGIICHYDDIDGVENNGDYESVKTFPILTSTEDPDEHFLWSDGAFAAEEEITLKKKQ